MEQLFQSMEQFSLSPKILKLLSVFFSSKKSSFYVRQLAQQLNWPPSTTSRLLNTLNNSQILNSNSLGNLKIYYLNHNHPLYQDLKNITNYLSKLNQ